MATTQRLQTIAVLCGLALAAMAAAGGGDVTLSPQDILSLLQTGGAIAVLVVGMVGFARGWWYWGAYVEELRKGKENAERERDTYREMAFRGTDASKTIADVMAQLLTTVKGP